jgi:hypothetical protein
VSGPEQGDSSPCTKRLGMLSTCTSVEIRGTKVRVLLGMMAMRLKQLFVNNLNHHTSSDRSQTAIVGLFL